MDQAAAGNVSAPNPRQVVMDAIREQEPKPTQLLALLSSQLSYGKIQDILSELLESGTVDLGSDRRLRMALRERPVPAAAPQAHIARCVCRGTPSVRHGICMRCRLPRRSTPHLPTQDLTTLAEKAAEKVSKFDMNFMEELANPDTSPSLDVDSDVSAPQAESVNEIWDIRHPASQSVPSGKQPFEIYDEFLQQYSDSVATNCQPPDVLLVWMEKWAIYYAASQTAALREQLKSAVSQLATQHDLKHEAERSNSLLRERITAAEKLMQDNPHDAWCDNSECLYCKNKDAYFEKENQ